MSKCILSIVPGIRIYQKKQFIITKRKRNKVKRRKWDKYNISSVYIYVLAFALFSLAFRFPDRTDKNRSRKCCWNIFRFNAFRTKIERMNWFPLKIEKGTAVATEWGVNSIFLRSEFSIFEWERLCVHVYVCLFGNCFECLSRIFNRSHARCTTIYNLVAIRSFASALWGYCIGNTCIKNAICLLANASVLVFLSRGRAGLWDK